MHKAPKNIASEAVQGLRLSYGKHNETAAWIERAVHFAVPSRGLLFDSVSQAHLDLLIAGLKLPYPEITIEYDAGGSIGTSLGVYREVIHLREENGCILLRKAQAYDMVYAKPYVYWNDYELEGIISPTEPVFTHRDADTGISKPNREAAITNSDMLALSREDVRWRSVRAVLDFLLALSCSNVREEISQKGSNDISRMMRKKQGKPPLYETRVLVIDRSVKKVFQTSQGGTHESPRQHLRRGHIRRLPKGNIWINSCVVGSAEKGSIEKSYTVK